MEEKKLIIIDSLSLLYRSFHALPPLMHNGIPTGAVYGYLLTLFKAIKDVRATHIVACFDMPSPTFRHHQFREYKAHRAEMPQGIAVQIPMAKEVLKAFHIPVLEQSGYEADDLIATIAEKSKAEAEVYIVSGDLDNLQLVDPRVKVYTPGKSIKESVLYDEQKVMERFMVRPDQMNDFKALVGDPSDNIPGVAGIGKKTAAELIQKYGSVQGLYDELATDTAVLKPKVKEALKANKDNALLSRQLVETKRDMEVSFDLKDSKFGMFNSVELRNTLVALGFNSLVDRINTIVL